MRITITLPDNSELLAEKGKKVTYGDNLYRIKKGRNYTINIAQQLSIQPQQIFHHLIKMVGEKVRKNEVIAIKKNILSAKKIYADCDGIIQKIDHRNGTLVLAIDNDDDAIVQSFFTGIIQEIDNNKIKVYFEKGDQAELESITNDWGGTLFYFTQESLYFKINEENIKNKIVIIEYLAPHIQVKCEALGVVGFVIMSKKNHVALPHAIFKKKDEYMNIIQSKKPFIACSVIDKIAVIYE